MDLVDILKEKRFLGQEFLTWLWWKSEERGGSLMLADFGEITLSFEKHMLLESGDGDAIEKLVCSGLQSELQEARTGLHVGKKLEQSRIVLAHDSFEYHFTLVGSTLDFKNVKLPETEKTDNQGGESAEETEGKILERAYLFEQLVKMVTACFSMFLHLRMTPEWADEVVKVRRWIAKNAEV